MIFFGWPLSKLLLILLLLLVCYPFLKALFNRLFFSTNNQEEVHLLDDKINRIIEKQLYLKKHLEKGEELPSFVKEWKKELEWGGGERSTKVVKEWNSAWGIDLCHLSDLTQAYRTFERVAFQKESDFLFTLEAMVTLKKILEEPAPVLDLYINDLAMKEMAKKSLLLKLEGKELDLKKGESLNYEEIISKIPFSTHSEFVIGLKKFFKMIPELFSLTKDLMAKRREHQKDFEFFNISPDSSQEKVKKTFRKLALQYHPDRRQGNPHAHESYIKLQESYERLTTLFILEDQIAKKWKDLSVFWP